MAAPLPNLKAILKRHNVPPESWPELHRFINRGMYASDELLRCLREAANYAAAFDDILAALSKKSKHAFPPDDYQAPVLYESLFCEDVATATSDG